MKAKTYKYTTEEYEEIYKQFFVQSEEGGGGVSKPCIEFFICFFLQTKDAQLSEEQ